MLEHPDRGPVRPPPPPQLQPPLQQQPRPARPPLPRVVAEEQEGVQGGADQVHRGDARPQRRLLRDDAPGDPVDAEPDRAERPARLPGVEGEVRRQGPAVLFAAELVRPHDQGAARGDPAAVHVHGVPEQLPVDPGPHRGRVLG